MDGENNIFELRRTIKAQPHSSRLVTLAREHTEAAINVIAQIMHKSEDDRTRLIAAEMLLDRGWGKPTQTLVNADSNDDSRA